MTRRTSSRDSAASALDFVRTLSIARRNSGNWSLWWTALIVAFLKICFRDPVAAEVSQAQGGGLERVFGVLSPRLCAAEFDDHVGWNDVPLPGRTVEDDQGYVFHSPNLIERRLGRGLDLDKVSVKNGIAQAGTW